MKNRTLKPPDDLTPESRKLWRSITSSYAIDPAASMILTATLQARDRLEAARKTIATEGQIQTDRFGQRKPHPAVGIARDEASTMMRGFRLLGMDLSQQPGRGDEL